MASWKQNSGITSCGEGPGNDTQSQSRKHLQVQDQYLLWPASVLRRSPYTIQHTCTGQPVADNGISIVLVIVNGTAPECWFLHATRDSLFLGAAAGPQVWMVAHNIPRQSNLAPVGQE